MIHSPCVTATFEIVTPMFLGGADQQVNRIRETSIKGALAFWWRALNYAQFVEKAEGCQTEALKAMQAEEQRLFGGPKGQGVFLLKAKSIPGKWKHLAKGEVLTKDQQKGAAQTVGGGACYLGYGIVNAFYTKARDGKPEKKAGELERSCITIYSTFILSIILKSNCPPEDITEILRVIKLFGLLGGLGSRVRRGWGSVALVDLKGEGIEPFDNWEPPSTPDEYKARLKEIIGNTLPVQNGTEFRLSAFAAETDIRVGPQTDGNALTVLDEIGKAMQKYRSWGFSGQGNTLPKVNGIDSEKNFESDHHWSKRKTGYANMVPKRTAFGLPQNYKDNGGVTGKQEKNKSDCINRRASPLFIHIHQTSENNAFPVLMLMPTHFLPTHEVNADGKNRAYDFHTDGLPILEHFLRQETPPASASKPFQNGPYLELTNIWQEQ
jgi:CRISPR-associated protein Cmr1